MKKILFISDFFYDEVLGGAELNDKILINFLSQSFNIENIKSIKVQNTDVDRADFIIVSNFVQLSHTMVQKIQREARYLIYEHDHKYVDTRDPSTFVGYKIPEKNITNKNFYSNARAVVVLSSICAEILKNNIPNTNVINIGCSLWDSADLDYIEDLFCKASKQNRQGVCVLKSDNAIKNTTKAIEYCEANGLTPVTPIRHPEYREFLRIMSKFETFVFIPKVLETFSRVCAEAKMLGVHLITNKNKVGFCSEDISELQGLDLIQQIKNRNKNAFKKFKSIILSSLECKKENVTVILNCYRRPEYLKEQVKAIREQSVSPKQIWVWVNHHEDSEGFDFTSLGVDRVIKSNFNWKYFGRFSIAMLAQTEYVAMFDDDTIPGPKWFENCLETMYKFNGILGGAGVKLRHSIYQGHNRVGWSSLNDDVEEVDLVGHAWFFKKEWLKYIWLEEPYTYENGEDIHFSYCAQKYGNIRTFCPPHPRNRQELHSSIKGYEYGVDEKASSHVSRHEKFYLERDSAVQHSIGNGWKTCKMRGI